MWEGLQTQTRLLLPVDTRNRFVLPGAVGGSKTERTTGFGFSIRTRDAVSQNNDVKPVGGHGFQKERSKEARSRAWQAQRLVAYKEDEFDRRLDLKGPNRT